MARFLSVIVLMSVTSLAAQVSSAVSPQTDFVSFNKDVLPILQKNCQVCHRTGEVAPMSFLTYESTRPWAKAIKSAVRWAKKNMAERTDYFHKYVVTAVVQSDRLTVDGQPASTFPEQVTRYEYLDGAAWHWDTSEFTKDDKLNLLTTFKDKKFETTGTYSVEGDQLTTTIKGPIGKPLSSRPLAGSHSEDTVPSRNSAFFTLSSSR